MKKFIKTFLMSIMIALLALSFSACSFLPANNGVTPNETPVINNPTNTPYEYSQADIASVVYNTDGVDASLTDLTMVEAVKMVERTSVAIYTSSGTGSGVIIDIKRNAQDLDTNVYIITCHHVIEDYGTDGKIQVAIPDQDCKYDNEDYIFEGKIGTGIYTDVAVTLIGGDRYSDIALLKLDLTKPAMSGKTLALTNIVKANVPNSYSVQKGETIFAIGNPAGDLPGTVSDGVISYLEREANVGDIGSMLLLQISVTINPGNSGGGLYNLKGELIGITNAGRTDYEALNYAIPAVLSNDYGYMNVARNLLGTKTDTNYGFVPGRKVKFGFTVLQQGTEQAPYVIVQEVTASSIAEAAGLQANDILVSVTLKGNTTTVNANADLASVVASASVGDVIQLKVKRKSNSAIIVQEMEKTIELPVYQYHFCNTGN